jgi:hypothetical protein
MRSSGMIFLGVGVGLMLAAISLISTREAVGDPAQAPGRTNDRRFEDIYVVRSLRESRDSPTEFCARSHSGFDDATSEDRYTFRSISIRVSDGRMMDNDVHSVGRLRACFGNTNDPKLQNFYAEGSLGRITFTGRGECLANKTDYPEAGITGVRCFLDLGGLSAEYIGGELTTNSIRSRKVIGGVSDPPGYTQPSIATIRLWRQRTGS